MSIDSDIQVWCYDEASNFWNVVPYDKKVNNFKIETKHNWEMYNMATASSTFSSLERQEIINARRKIVNMVEQFEEFRWVRGLLFDPMWCVAGGAISSILRHEDPKDIDIFITNNEHTLTIEEKLTKSGYVYKDTNYSSGLDARRVMNHANSPLQFVFTNCKTVGDILDGFDYVHCMAFLAYRGNVQGERNGVLSISRQTFDCIKTRTLIVNKTPQQYRIDKFKAEKWSSLEDKLKELSAYAERDKSIFNTTVPVGSIFRQMLR